MRVRFRILFLSLFMLAIAFLVATGPEATSGAPAQAVPAAETVAASPARSVRAGPALAETRPLRVVPALTEASLAEYRKCFDRVARVRSLAGIYAELLREEKFSDADRTEESYEVRAPDGREYVVQVVPAEADAVRVFEISAVDGLPDRVRDFPAAGAEPRRRLRGALSLGRQEAHETVSVRTAEAGATLTVTEREGEEDSGRGSVAALRYSAPGVDFECRETRCRCFRR